MNRLRKWGIAAVIGGVLCSFPQITGVQEAEAATSRIAGTLFGKINLLAGNAAGN